MNSLIKAIATIMIVVLIMMLIWTFLAYYKNNNNIDTIVYMSGDSHVFTSEIPNGNYINDENQNSTLSGNQGLIESIINTSDPLKGNNNNVIQSGDNNIKDNYVQQETQITESGESDSNISGENINRENIDKEVNVSQNSQNENKDNPEVGIVIVSNPQTSNQEKQEVLTEIDKALQGLLEAVSKVEVVDEKRLDASLNSEVEQP